MYAAKMLSHADGRSHVHYLNELAGIDDGDERAAV